MTRNNIALACGGAAAAALAAIGFAGAGFAHPHPEGEEKVRKVIILDSKGEPGKGHERLRDFRVLGSKDFKCEGERTEIDETTGDKEKERTRFVYCHDGKLKGAERAKKLEEALAKIRLDDDLSAEHRAKVEAALQDAIARLRSTN